MSKYKALAFDLDDTLLDTSKYLVPRAAQKACTAMIAAGLQCELNDCLQLRANLANQLSHPEIFVHIADTFGAENRELAIAQALDAFYNPEVPEDMTLMPGALENLRELGKHYSLYLVTMGNRQTQLKKIKSLKLEPYFEKIYIFDSLLKERKESAFREIIQAKKLAPDELLSIGNRLSSEIRDGKRAGADTCYFAHGEHLGEIPQLPEDQPDYTVHSHPELIQACGL